MLKPLLKSACIAAALLLAAGSLQAKEEASQPQAAAFKGNVVELRSGKLRPSENDADLDKLKYFVYYYSASWCGPCLKFTPELNRWYKREKKKHPEFEVFLVNSDADEEKMADYMKKSRMPFPAVAFDKRDSFKKYGGRGIPCLVVVDKEGKVLHHSYVDGKYVGPRKVLEDFEEQLKQDSKEAKDS